MRNIGCSCASAKFSSSSAGGAALALSSSTSTASGDSFPSGLEVAATSPSSQTSSSDFFADLCVEGNADIAVSVTPTVKGGGGISLGGWLENSIALGGWIAPVFTSSSPLIVTFFLTFASKITAEAVAASSSVPRPRGFPSICGAPTNLAVSLTPPTALLAGSIPRARLAASSSPVMALT